MIHYILGAPGSGKTSTLPHLRRILPGWIVIDWDELMHPAEGLAGRSIRDNAALWKPYESLMRDVVKMLAPHPILLLGVCTPSQLEDWHVDEWTVLDCGDAERAARLRRRGEQDEEIQEALEDATEYRSLGLDILDANALTPEETAQAIADNIRRP